MRDGKIMVYNEKITVFSCKIVSQITTMPYWKDKKRIILHHIRQFFQLSDGLNPQIHYFAVYELFRLKYFRHFSSL